MFLLILAGLLYVFVDFGAETYTRPTKINKNIQKTHQNQQKHTKDPPKSTQTYKRPTKINTNMYVFVDFGGSFVCLC
jgi:uncharacterized membrane protein YagU involved in acid resistance